MRRKITLDLLPVGSMEINRMQKVDQMQFVCNME